MEKQYICVDIGGTFIKHGLVSRTGDFLHRGAVETESKKGEIGRASCRERV